MGDVAALVVGGRQRDGELHRLVAPVETGRGEPGPGDLTLLDGTRQVPRLPGAPAQRDAASRPGQPDAVERHELVERLDGVAEPTGRLQCATVRQQRPLQQLRASDLSGPFHHTGRRGQGRGGVPALERGARRRSGPAELVGLAGRGAEEEVLRCRAQPSRQHLEQRQHRAARAGLDAGTWATDASGARARAGSARRRDGRSGSALPGLPGRRPAGARTVSSCTGTVCPSVAYAVTTICQIVSIDDAEGLGVRRSQCCARTASPVGPRR